MTDNLMSKREFAPLFWTQFLSAFNDNFLKNTLIFLILATVAIEQSGTLVTVAGAKWPTNLTKHGWLNV